MAHKVYAEPKERILQTDRKDAPVSVSEQKQKGEDTLIAKLGRKFINRYRKDLEALARK